ncbi:hypothetical protein JXA80_13675 [bacterium]|nr:hypothetical protein [candidate division CSSED10-310 bacterium]
MDRRLTVIFILLFVLYLSGTRFSLDGYELEYVLSAMNVVHGNGPSLAPGYTDCPGIHDTTGPIPVYPRQNLLQTVLSVPLYATGAVLFGEQPTIPNRGGYWNLPWGPVAAVSCLNPLLAALIAVWTALLAGEFGIAPHQRPRIAVVTGTMTMIWHYAGLGMEILHTAVLTGCVLAAIRFRFTGRNRWLMAAIIGIVALPNCKKHSFIFIVPVIVYLAWAATRHHSHTVSRAVIGTTLAAAVLGGICMVIGAVIRFQADPFLFPSLLRNITASGFKSVDLLAGLTLSPGEGLFVFNPILLFAAAGWPSFNRAYPAEARLFTAFTVILLVVLWRIPYILIDEEWGPRYLVCLLPMMIAAGAPRLIAHRKGIAKILFVAVICISLLVHWVSAMYLGFKIVDASLGVSITDYMVTVFLPSQSQMYVMMTCFGSHIRYLVTGEHGLLIYRQYRTYTGRGGDFLIHRLDLGSYDYPAGGLFTIRWVLNEMERPSFSEQRAFLIRVTMDLLLLAGLGWVSWIRRKNQPDGSIIGPDPVR